MKFLFVLLLLLFCSSTNAQKSSPFPKIPLSLYHQPEAELIERYNMIKDYEYEALSRGEKLLFDLTHTVYHVYIGNDSPSKYLLRSMDNYKKGTCRVLVGANNNHDSRINDGIITPDINWFLLDIEDVDANRILLNCTSYMDSLKATKPAKPIVISPVIRKMKNRDEKYRVETPVNWNMQNKLDSINRVTLDSIYNNIGSLREYSEDEIFVFSMVLHHSDDCDWNMKWTEIFLGELKVNKIQGAFLLGPAVNRMFNKDGNSCYNLDSTKVENFIVKMRNNYPEISKSVFEGL